MQIEVSKYFTPITARGFDFMAFDNDLESDRGIFGFGATPEEAIADFQRQLEQDIAA